VVAGGLVPGGLVPGGLVAGGFVAGVPGVHGVELSPAQVALFPSEAKAPHEVALHRSDTCRLGVCAVRFRSTRSSNNNFPGGLI
jgi:hypothetical protein